RSRGPTAARWPSSPTAARGMPSSARRVAGIRRAARSPVTTACNRSPTSTPSGWKAIQVLRCRDSSFSCTESTTPSSIYRHPSFDFPQVGCYVGFVGQVTTGTVVPGGGELDPSALDVEVLLTEADRVALLRAEARRGLTATPKQLPPKWFYDERGSSLFESITRQPEYYLTRREREILQARAGDIARTTRAATLVELGSGTSEKTRLLLDALRDAG